MDRLALAIHGERGAPIPLDEWTGEPLDDCTLILELAGVERVAHEWSLGDTAAIALQLSRAAERLDAGEEAFVHSAVDDEEELPSLRFEPRGDRIDVSLFVAGERAWGPLPTARAPLVVAMRREAATARRLLRTVDWERVALPTPTPRPSNRDRPMIEIPKTTFRVGLEAEEADRLAEELARMEEQLHDPGLGAFRIFDLASAIRRRRAALEASMPAHEVTVGPFAIDVFPVTRAMYAEWAGTTAPRGTEQRFVTSVSWTDARSYAQSFGLDLPTEDEWEIAARAPGRSFFTWGDAYFPEGDVACREPVSEPWDVGTRPEIASALGVHDLLGAFGEWCLDPFAPYPGADRARFDARFPDSRGQRVVRGGYDVEQDATCVSRRGVPDEPRAHVRFRCVRR